MKKFSLCLVALLTFSFASQLLAITDEEIFRSFSLNLSTPGARARAMGGAFIGRADDATAAQTNPAGLSLLIRPEVSFEYRFVNSKTVATNIVQIPVSNFDITPSPIVNPDPGGNLDSGVAEFHASDTAANVNELGYFSIVYPISGFTVAFSRHELINTDANVSGRVSASPFHFYEPNSFQGNVNIADTNYGVSVAGKITDMFSVGGSILVSDFSFVSNIGAKQKDQGNFGDHFTSTINTQSTKVGFNAGILIRPTHEISIGAVYRYEPKFTLDAVVNNVDFHPTPLIVSRAGVNKIDFDVPDSFGVGVSLSPTQKWNIDLDVVRVLYSQLGPVETGFSLFTHLLPIIDNANQIFFKVDDGTDIHVGAEYLITMDKSTVALRGGYYHQTRNRFFLDHAVNPKIDAFLRPIFGSNPGNDLSHWTTGVGLTLNKVEFDTAVDFVQQDDVKGDLKQEISDGGWDFIFSSVFRF